MNKDLIGAIGFSGQIKGGNFFQRMVEFFTNSRWSHSFIVTFPFNGSDAVEEASLTVDVIPLDNYRKDPNAKYEIYKINDATQDAISRSLENCFVQYAGVEYGFFQVFYFVFRWVYIKLGIDVKKLPQFVRDGIICSELTYDHATVISHVMNITLMYLDQDTVAPQDIYEVVKKYPENFTLLESKDEKGIRKFV